MEMVKNWLYKILITPTWISVLIGKGLVLWQWLAGDIPPSVQYTIFVSFIFLTGIPHGAIDHLVEKETAKRLRKNFTMTTFLSKYLLTMLFYGFVWYLLPSVSLIVFLIISAWHFGETDIDKVPPTSLWSITRFIFGSFVLLYLLLLHAEETTPIIERIIQNNTSTLSIWMLAVEFKTFVLLSVLLLFMSFYFMANAKDKIDTDKIRLVRLSLILLSAYFLPLLPAFSLYFGGWHALSSFQSISHYLVRNPNIQAGLPIIRSTVHIWKKTLLFTCLASVGLISGVWYWHHFLQSWDPLPLLFIFLSLITMPHLTVMHRMNKVSI